MVNKKLTNVNKKHLRKKKDLVNDLIPFPRLVVVDENEKSLGVLDKKQALLIAKNKNLDLFCVNPHATIPICKIVNYDNYRFNQQKSLRKWKQKKPELESKEIRISAGIGINDLKFKVAHCKKFLQKKNKVKITMRLRGREKYVPNYGLDKINLFLELVKEYAKLAKPPKLKNNAYNMVLESINKK